MNVEIEVGDTVKAWPRNAPGESFHDEIAIERQRQVNFVVRSVGTIPNYHLEREDIPGVFVDAVYCELVEKKPVPCAHTSLFFPMIASGLKIGGANPYKFCPWCGVAIDELPIEIL